MEELLMEKVHMRVEDTEASRIVALQIPVMDATGRFISSKRVT